MTGPLTITCPSCGEGFPVPAEVVKVDVLNNQVLVRLDRTGAFGHFTNCATRKGKPHISGRALVPVEGVSAHQLVVPVNELAGRIHQMLQGDHYIAVGGSRACNMCGVNGADCLAQLWEPGKGVPCCSACGNGNTHPAPQELDACSTWAESHGAKN